MIPPDPFGDALPPRAPRPPSVWLTLLGVALLVLAYLLATRT